MFVPSIANEQQHIFILCNIMIFNGYYRYVVIFLNVSYVLHTPYADTLFVGIYLKLGKNCYRVHTYMSIRETKNC